MRLILASLVALVLLSVGLMGHVRTVRSESKPEIPVSSVPTATQRAAKALSLLSGGPVGP